MTNMIIATDLSDRSINTLRIGIKWSKQHNQTPIILHVEDNVPDAKDGILEGAFSGKEELKKSNINPKTKEKLFHHLDQIPEFDGKIEIWSGVVLASVLQSITNNNASFMVIGLKGHSLLEQIFIGSIAQRLFEYATVPILGVHESLKELPQSPLICTETLKLEEKAVAIGKILFDDSNIHLNFLHIVNPKTVLEISNYSLEINDLNTALEIAKTEALDKANILSNQFNNPIHTYIEKGHYIAIGEFILDYLAKQKNDLLVMGSHGHHGIKRWLLGSTTDYILKRTAQSILIIP